MFLIKDKDILNKNYWSTTQQFDPKINIFDLIQLIICPPTIAKPYLVISTVRMKTVRTLKTLRICPSE